MADERAKEYKIIIETKTEEKKVPTEPEEEPEQTLAEKLVALRKSIRGIAGFSVAVGLAKQSFDWSKAVVLRDEGSSIVSQKVDTSLSIAAKTGAIGGAAFWSAMSGNVAGLIASFGAAMSTVIGYAKEIEQNQYDRKWETTGLMIARERGGTAYNRSRL